MEWDGTGRGGMGRDRMGWDRDGIGWDGMGCWLGSDFLDFIFESCGVAMKGKNSKKVLVHVEKV